MKFIWEVESLNDFCGVEIIFRVPDKDGLLIPNLKKTSILGFVDAYKCFDENHLKRRVYLILDPRWGTSYILGLAEAAVEQLNAHNYVPVQFLSPKKFVSPS